MLNKVMNTTLLEVTATFSIFVAYKCSEKSLKFTQKSRESRDYFRFADYSFNPQRPNPEQSEKAFIKPFEAPQRSMKTKI